MIGFGGDNKVVDFEKEDFFLKVFFEDLFCFGLIFEFIGCFLVIVSFEKFDEEVLVVILIKLKNVFVK